jgi:hypothetical protein
VGRGLFPYVLANDRLLPRGEDGGPEPVALDYPPGDGYHLLTADLVSDEVPWQHNPHKLAAQILDFYCAAKT